MTKDAARAPRPQSKGQEEAWLTEVLPLIERTKSEGITLTLLKTQIPDAKPAPLARKLKALLAEKAIQEIKHTPPGGTRDSHYFAAEHGPTPATVGAKITRFLEAAPGDALNTEKSLRNEVEGIEAAFVTAAIKHALAAGTIRGPFGKGRCYFGARTGPTTESVGGRVARVVQQAGGEPVEEKSLTKEVSPAEALFLTDALTHALAAKTIRGPFGKEKYYFPAHAGPTVEGVRDKVAHLVQEAGAKLTPVNSFTKRVSRGEALFLTDAIGLAVGSRMLLELTYGRDKLYVHRDVAVEHFGLAAAADMPLPPAAPTSTAGADLTFQQFLSAYRRLKAEQDGVSAVEIFDLIRVLGVPKEMLHALILKELGARRLSIHHSTSVLLPREVIDAGIRIRGETEPFVTVVVKGEH